MSGQKKSKTFGGTSLPLESIVHEGCWTSDLENAKTGVDKYLQHTKNKKTSK